MVGVNIPLSILDAAFIETPVVQAYANTYKNLQIACVIPQDDNGSVIGVYKGNAELLKYVNEAINKCISDGTFAQYVAKAVDLAAGDTHQGLLDENGNQLGIMPLSEARSYAFDHGVDLVLIAPQATPPVCRAMDYGKYRYECDKKEKDAKKKQSTVEVKEVQLSCRIEQHDFDTRINHAKKFLAEGNKVKAVVRFRGRELNNVKMPYFSGNAEKDVWFYMAMIEAYKEIGKRFVIKDSE